MPDGKELLEAFKESRLPAIQERLGVVERQMMKEAKYADSLDPEERGMWAAGVELFVTINPEQPDLGKVCMLERLCDFDPADEVIGDIAIMVRDRFKETAQEPIANRIIDKMYVWGSFLGEDELRSLRCQFERTCGSNPDGRDRIEEIDKAINWPPETMIIRRVARVGTDRRTDLAVAFAPEDSVGRLTERRDRIRERLEVLAGMSQVFSEEGKAVLMAATELLGTIGDNTAGKLALLENVLDIEPTSYHAFNSMVVTRRP